MISATWRGINTTRKRALLLQKAFPKMVEVASYAVAEKVQENAMDILNQNRQETSGRQTPLSILRVFSIP